MANQSRGPERRRTRPTIEPSVELDEYDEELETPEVTPISRAERRRRSRPSRGNKITIGRVEHKPIVVEFVGEEYEIVPPRMDALIEMGKTGDDSDPSSQLKVWLWDAFGEDGYNDVLDRIEDPADDAGWEEVKDLIQAVSAHVGKNRRT